MFHGPVTWLDNEAINNARVGFQIRMGEIDRGPVILQNNLARGAGTGFTITPGFSNDEAIDHVTAVNVTLVGNTATANGWGFDINSAGDVHDNSAIGNSQAGFLLVPANAAFTTNTAIGNAGPGVIVNFSKDPDTPSRFDLPAVLPTFHGFSHNTIFGNDRNRPALQLGLGLPLWNPGPSAHCAVLNVGALAWPSSIDGNSRPGPPAHLTVANNYWGSAHGPLSTGPGDAVGGACDQNNGATTATPFSPIGF